MVVTQDEHNKHEGASADLPEAADSLDIALWLLPSVQGCCTGLGFLHETVVEGWDEWSDTLP